MTRSRPHGVARPAHLGPLARLLDRPPGLEPVAVGTIRGGTEALDPGGRVDQDEPEPPGVVDLDDRARHHVEQLVSHHEADDAVGEAAGPTDPGVEAFWTLDDVNRHEAPAVGGEVDEGREQLAAARPHVDDREVGRRPQARCPGPTPAG